MIKTNPGVDSSAISEYTRTVLEHLLTASGNPSLTVTCLGRSVYDQARVMRENCIKNGTAAQLALYKEPGQAVVRVYMASGKLDRDHTLLAMVDKINEMGPGNVSRHCGDQTKLAVLDIAQSSLKDPKAFKVMATSHCAEVSHILDENGCFHIEVPQPSGESNA